MGRGDRSGSAVLRLATWSAGFVLFHGACVLLASSIEFGDHTLLQILAKDPREARGHSALRFRDLERHGPVDLLFVGSSHCYRAFDPRWFAARGLDAFNMGSTAQTPLNSYYLLERYLAPLRPSIVIIETYYEVLDKDGLESFYDLVHAVPPPSKLLGMALATRIPHAVNILAAELFHGGSPIEAHRDAGEGSYVGAGYVETLDEASDSLEPHPHEVVPLERQLTYLARCIRLARRRGSAVVLVIQPLPTPTLQALLNRAALRDRLSSLAHREGATFLASPGQDQLDPRRDFMDSHHLNARGVEQFNRRVLERLFQAGLVRRERAGAWSPAGRP